MQTKEDNIMKMQDKNLALIKSVVKSFGNYEVFLFGSRARGDNRPGSDYDIIVVVTKGMDKKSKLLLIGNITEMLARKGIDADVLVRSQGEINIQKEWFGSVVNNALENWIRL
jgi:predicted nucleotidyltransferase